MAHRGIAEGLGIISALGKARSVCAHWPVGAYLVRDGSSATPSHVLR